MRSEKVHLTHSSCTLVSCVRSHSAGKKKKDAKRKYPICTASVTICRHKTILLASHCVGGETSMMRVDSPDICHFHGEKTVFYRACPNYYYY